MGNKISNIFNMITYIKNVLLINEKKNIINSIIKEDQALKYIEKYSYVIKDSFYHNKPNNHRNKIWQLWFQGLEVAPPIVRKCLASVEENFQDHDIIVLDEKNIKHYIDIESFIYDKKKKGYISDVNFSDILRAYLLSEYGGTWIDATVFLTGKVDSLINNKNLFCFSTTPFELLGYSKILASSWFIHAAQDSRILKVVKNLMNEYWLHENYCIHHYYFHLFFLMAVIKDEECMKEWENVPFYSNVPPHVLQFELFNDFSYERYNQIIKMTPIHKLTYYGGDEFKSDLKGTYFDFIVNK